MGAAISDERVARVLSAYAGLAARLLDDTAAWADEPAEAASGVRRMVRLVRDRTAGDRRPGGPGWDALSVDQRTEWWVRRVALVAAPLAATPRVAGVVADRLPLQDALGASAAGLAVCAAARERGVTDPDDWVPLLGRVLLDRELPRGHVAGAEVELAPDDEPPAVAGGGALRRGARGLWRLTRTLLSLYVLFDERPRGRLAFRALGKVPVVGLVGGVLDERGGVRRAASETARLLDDPS